MLQIFRFHYLSVAGIFNSDIKAELQYWDAASTNAAGGEGNEPMTSLSLANTPGKKYLQVGEM